MALEPEPAFGVILAEGAVGVLVTAAVAKEMTKSELFATSAASAHFM